MLNVLIRTLTERDITKVQDVATKSWNDTYDGVIPLDVQARFLQHAYSNNALLHRIETSHFFVAEQYGDIIGFANFSFMDEHGQVELGALYLLPNLTGQGIGTYLLETGLQQIGQVKRVLVHVEKQNKRAMQFYVNKGFTFIKECKEVFYGHPLASIQLMLYVTE